MSPFWQNVLLASAAAVAGAVNSVAGGGTLLTFPALLGAGFASTAANATSTVALWPGQLSSLFGLRGEIGESRRVAAPMLLIGLLGGAGGAWLLTVTPTRIFDRVVPFLILTATLLFLAQEPLARRKREAADADAPRWGIGVALFLLGVALYGGYFGAGIGILTLAAFGMMGLSDIHRMNGLKAIFTLGINGIASGLFIVRGLVDWKVALWMAAGALFGGYAGVGIARKIGARNVRRVVIVIGFGLAAIQLVKAFG